MGDMDALRTELARRTLRDGTQAEFGAGQARAEPGWATAAMKKLYLTGSAVVRDDCK